MIEGGIVDPTIVSRSALQNAASVAPLVPEARPPNEGADRNSTSLLRLSDEMYFSAFLPEGTILTLYCCAESAAASARRRMNMKNL